MAWPTVVVFRFVLEVVQQIWEANIIRGISIDKAGKKKSRKKPRISRKCAAIVIRGIDVIECMRRRSKYKCLPFNPQSLEGCTF